MRNSWIEWQLGEIMKIMKFHDFLGKIDQKFMDIHAWPEIEFSQWLEISPEIQGISKSDLSEHSTFSKNFIMDIMGMLWDLPIKCRDFIMDIMGFNCQPLEIHGDSPSWVSKNGGEIHPCPHGGLVHDGLVGFESSNNSLGIFLPMLKQRMVFFCDFLWWKKRFQEVGVPKVQHPTIWRRFGLFFLGGSFARHDWQTSRGPFLSNPTS